MQLFLSLGKLGWPKNSVTSTCQIWFLWLYVRWADLRLKNSFFCYSGHEIFSYYFKCNQPYMNYFFQPETLAKIILFETKTFLSIRFFTKLLQNLEMFISFLERIPYYLTLLMTYIINEHTSLVLKMETMLSAIFLSGRNSQI